MCVGINIATLAATFLTLRKTSPSVSLILVLAVYIAEVDCCGADAWLD
jgi:hypothetical protein